MNDQTSNEGASREASSPPGIAQDAGASSTEWFYAVDDNRRGPVSETILIDKIKSGGLGRKTKVWREGLPKWILLENTPFREFLPKAGPPPLDQVDHTDLDALPPDPVSSIPPPLPTEPAADLPDKGVFELPKSPTPPHKIFAIIGIVACLMVLFPPVDTYNSPVVVEDKGIEWQLRGGDPNLVVVDRGGFRDKRFAFILSLGENDKILFPQLVFQEVGLAVASLVVVAWKGKRDINQRQGQGESRFEWPTEARK
jgi:hypothetical protein